MDLKLTSLERAFQLAKSGNCATIEDIRRALRSEGYGTEQIVGPALLRQLRAILATSRPATMDTSRDPRRVGDS
jgi:hypothetical protein